METYPPTLEVSFGELPKGIGGVRAGSGEAAFLGKIRKARPKIKGTLKPLSQGSISCSAHLSQSYTSSLQQRPPPRHRHTPQAADKTERRRRPCQKNPEGRKLDRQTEADPGFTVPERHPPDSQTVRDTLLFSSQEEDRESRPQSLPKPNSSSLGIEQTPAKQEALNLTSLSPYSSPKGFFGPRQGPPFLSSTGPPPWNCLTASPPAKPTSLRIFDKGDSSRHTQPLLLLGSAWG